MRRAERNEIQRIFRAYAGQMQSLVKAGAQLAHKCQRAAEVDDLPLDRASLRQSRNRLVDDRHEDGARYIRTRRALVK